MSYSQGELIRLMKEGSVSGEDSVPKHIETVISNVFLFPKFVYKFYKNDNDFFNKNFRDISSREARFAFARKDFAWNNALSPDIYLRLVGARIVDGKVEIGEPADDAEELVLMMNRMHSEDMLYEKLARGEISEEDGYRIGTQLAESLKRVRKETPAGNYFLSFKNDIQGVRDWIAGVPEFIPEDEWTRYCDFLDQFRIRNQEWYEGKLTAELAYSGDIHSHNALYSDGQFSLMDTYAPKDEWRIAHALVPFYRVGADLWAFGGKDTFEEFLRGYEERSGIKVDRRLDAPYILYAAGIMVPYLYMLQKTDESKKEMTARYHDFLRNFYERIAQA
jgi:aminoglycoside phosphotransferase family enzyme